MNKVYVQEVDYSICNMFERNGYPVVDTPEEANIICFVGGPDVDPRMYMEENISSHCDVSLDLESVGLFTRVFHQDKLLVGICRGGQFLNVMMGGSMRQHVPEHAGPDHWVSGPNGPVKLRSDHHQAMLPNLSLNPRVYTSLDDYSVSEIVVYKGVLCFQPHPEYHPSGSETEELFFQLLEYCLC